MRRALSLPLCQCLGNQASAKEVRDAWRSVFHDIECHTLHVDACNHLGETLLHFAALNGLPRDIACLLRLGADPSLPTRFGALPVHYVSHTYDTQDMLAKYTLLPVKNLAVQNNHGWTPLHCLLHRYRGYGTAMDAFVLDVLPWMVEHQSGLDVKTTASANYAEALKLCNGFANAVSAHSELLT